MITPDEIRAKAQRLYPDVLRAWLDGDESFFPRVVPAEKRLAGDDPAGSIQAVRLLRDGSKADRGFGYTVEWRERKSRTHGQNQFPERIFFETRDDLLRLIGRQREFESFAAAVTRLRAEFPVLDGWIRTNSRALIELAPAIDGLVEVLRYFLAHPRPERFARELPLSVDTKFIGNHQGVLAAWFDLLLPPHTIRAEESHFERRYGLRYAEPHFRVRLLDHALQTELRVPFAEFSLPLAALGELAVRDTRVFIIENKVNLLTFPATPRSIALGGVGSAAVEFHALRWLHENPLTYWGDLDVEGLQILANFRALFPHAESLLMDADTLRQFRHLAGPGNVFTGDAPPHLTASEREAYLLCRDEQLRLEQERLPQAFVEAVVARRVANRAADSLASS